jgi:nucleotide-binding universal stress UspA family protein
MPAPYAAIACFIEDGVASDAALAEAAALRALSSGELRVVHVLSRSLWLTGPFGETPGPVEFARAATGWLEDRVRGLPDATARPAGGRACAHRLRLRRPRGVDLIVAAAHRGVVERAMLGSFAAYVAYHAPCPVLLVHPPAAAVAQEDPDARAEAAGP